jgi:RNA polymerase sigma-70 factor (ECF subfamily)
MPGLLAGGDTAPALVGHLGEEEFARLLKAHSLAAWQILFDEHFDGVYRYALARLCSREAAEDVAAATFQRALATINGYSYVGRPAIAWLYGIARNIVKETRRSEMRQQATGLAGYLLRHNNGNGNQPSDPLGHSQADGTDGLVSRMDLEQAMLRLTQVQREVVRLRYFAGLSAAETGRVIGRPDTAVYALQARALLALRRQLV